VSESLAPDVRMLPDDFYVPPDRRATLWRQAPQIRDLACGKHLHKRCSIELPDEPKLPGHPVACPGCRPPPDIVPELHSRTPKITVRGEGVQVEVAAHIRVVDILSGVAVDARGVLLDRVHTDGWVEYARRMLDV
jgi:hypothetical protein